MAKKEKNESPVPVVLDGLPENSEEMLVQKSWPLLALWRSDLTLPELKILDTFLARINSHNPDAHTVHLEKGELESILGVSRINFPDLQERLGHLMAPVILQSENEFRQIVLFEESYASREHGGLWEVTLTCTNAAMKYFFNVEDLGYLRYKLRAISALGSRYSYVLFLYIEANRFRSSWEVGLESLRRILKCEEDPTYDSYKRFNDRLLKRCYQELTEKTELRFHYEPVRTGRSVTGVRFTVESLPVLTQAAEQGSEQTSFFDVFDPEAKAGEKPQEKPRENAEQLPEKPLDQMSQRELLAGLWQGEEIEPETGGMYDSSSDYADILSEFSPVERLELYAALCCVPDSRLPDLNGLRARRSGYLRQKLAELQRRAAGGKVKNRYAYLLKMIQNDQK